MALKDLRIDDIGSKSPQLVHIDRGDLPPLPPPYDQVDAGKSAKPLGDDLRSRIEASLDDTSALGMPRPQSAADERELVRKFLSGLQKLMSKENNWAFLQQLKLSIDNCARCQTCNDACPIYESSGRNDLYRPTYRSEVFRRVVHEHTRTGGVLLGKLKGEHVDLDWTTIARLLELSYRCTLCRRCAQACPIGVDNGLIAREIRKLFSMELGIAPRELHAQGSALHLGIGSSTGMNPPAARDNVEFLDREVSDTTGISVRTPWDKEGADVLLVHNAGEIMAWPENPMAYALILEAAGLSWTLSSDLTAYDGVNYGLWYDDAQLARIAIRQAQAAKKLKVKKIVIGECGHGHKALAVTADRLLTGDLNIPRESALVLLRDIVKSGRLKLDPARNDFPVTLHDPCNMVRLMGIVNPQREILEIVCPQFREMTPHGVDNYCCGGGSGFALMSSHNFRDWRLTIAGRMKLRQILNAFADQPSPEIRKYVCAPCSNCKAQIRDLFEYYGVWDRSGILYGGIAELIANAMTDIKQPFIQWEMH